MRARRRVFIISICVLLFVAAVGSVVLLRKQAAPEAARLLPEADAVLYVDFGTVRNLTAFDQQQVPKLAPGYDQFVKDTGFAFERDLDEAAMAVHRSPNRGATRYSEILVGHYDQIKLAQYLRQHSRSVESYRDVDVYSIPIENRTLRVALLAIDTVAVSNVDDPSVVHGMIDRFKKVALPFGGPILVHTYFSKVPLGSLLWAIARVPGTPPPTASKPHAAPSFTLPGGIDIGLPGDSDVVVSLRMLTTIHARAEFYTQSEDAARNFTDQTTTFLALFRSMQANTAPGPADADVKAVFDSIKVTQKGERAEVQATIPPSFLRKLINDPARNAVTGETPANSDKH
ncbi:MAG TPA: hypothetical protein VM578_03555 [Candidatus Saccharimonadales bacterium]|nr:hypothetical protein [Candidatus Saccharimonadales bacterium]